MTMVHWLIFLESDPSVKWFDLDPSRDGEASPARTDNDCVEVHRVDGGKAWHRVFVGGSRHIPDIDAPAKSQATPLWEIFGDAELKPHVRRAMRWLKAIGYAAVIRNEKHKEDAFSGSRGIRLPPTGRATAKVEPFRHAQRDASSTTDAPEACSIQKANRSSKHLPPASDTCRRI